MSRSAVDQLISAVTAAAVTTEVAAVDMTEAQAEPSITDRMSAAICAQRWGVTASPRCARYWMRRAAARGNVDARRWLRADR